MRENTVKNSLILCMLFSLVWSIAFAQSGACPPDDIDRLKEIDNYIYSLQADPDKLDGFIDMIVTQEQYTTSIIPILEALLVKTKLPENQGKDVKHLLSEADWNTIRTIVCELLANRAVASAYKFRYNNKLYDNNSTVQLDEGISEIIYVEIVNNNGEAIQNTPVQWTGATGPGNRAEVSVGMEDKTLEVQAMVNTTPARIRFSRSKPLVIESIDKHFAPSTENLELKYTVKVDTFRFARIEIFKNGDNTNPVYVSNIPSAKAEKVLVVWDGRFNAGSESGRFASFLDSPLNVKISGSSTSTFGKSQSDQDIVKVEIESIVLSPGGKEDLLKQTPAQASVEKEISATIKIRNKQNRGVVTALPATIHWTFEDPDDDSNKAGIDHNLGIDNDNTPVAHGGKDQTTGTFWRIFPGFQGTVNQISATADVQISGVSMGQTKLFFSSSVIAGDNYILVAAIKDAQGNVIKEEKTRSWTVKKTVTFNNIYTMAGGINFNSVMSVGNVNPAYDNDDGCTIYSAPANQQALGAAQSPEYVAPLLLPIPLSDSLNTELPTAQELTDYRSGNAAAKAAAQAAITAKAQRWFQRNMDQLPGKVDSLRRALNIQAPAIVGARYYHPKLSGRNISTSYYPSGIQINAARPGNPALIRDPDDDWREVQAFEDQTSAWFFLNNRASAARQIIVARHETGHAADHVSFGGGDHAPNGLMHYNADQSVTNPDGVDTFSDDSYEKLRGRR